MWGFVLNLAKTDLASPLWYGYNAGVSSVLPFRNIRVVTMKRAIFLTLAVISLAGGCVDSQAPLSSADTSKVNEGIVGTWRESTNDGETIYHIGLAGDKYPAGMLRIVAVTSHNNTLEAPLHYIGYTTTLNGKSYLNVVLDEAKIKSFDQNGWDAEKVEGYYFVKYKLDGDKASVWATNSKAKEEAIKAGKIKGMIAEQGESRFTDTAANVAKFLSAAGNSLWSNEPGHMERVVTAKK